MKGSRTTRRASMTKPTPEHPCLECGGTGIDAARTAKRPRWETSGYIACNACMGTGRDLAEYFMWGEHKPLKGV